MKNYLKILPLGRCFRGPKSFWKSCVEEKDRINPIMGRDGYYWNRQTGQTWLEIKGEAWNYCNVDHFKHDLNSFSHKPVRDKELNAILILIRARLASEELKDLYWMEMHKRDLRRIRIETRLLVKKALGH